jgi:hypothetical protein
MRDGPGPSRAVHCGPMVARNEGTGARRRAHWSLAYGHSGASKLTSVGTTEREGNTGNPARASPGLRRWRGDWVMMGKQKQRERSATVSYPVFTPKLSTHRMHDPGSIVPHIRPKVLTDNQMS